MALSFAGIFREAGSDGEYEYDSEEEEEGME